MQETGIDGLVLFSGGLDSLLTAKLLAEQGLRVRCLHYVSPFFGNPFGVARWKRLYDIDVEVLDASAPMVAIVNGCPPHGFGKGMNPCVDCKITLLSLAKRRMEELGAHFLATGEVVGQRPMSQRRDVLNTIRREAGVEGILLRPLCALHLDPTPMELSGLVDRSRLMGLSGRGRLGQLALARHYGITEIPSPGGGCLLTERENVCRYWPLRTRREGSDEADYRLADVGRQFWSLSTSPVRWLVVGRNSRDNENVKAFARGSDLLAGLCDFSGPLGLLREGADWDPDLRGRALALLASYSPRAREAGGAVRIWLKDVAGSQSVLSFVPERPGADEAVFTRMTFAEVRAEKHEFAREQFLEAQHERDLRRLAGERARAAREGACGEGCGNGCGDGRGEAGPEGGKG